MTGQTQLLKPQEAQSQRIELLDETLLNTTTNAMQAFQVMVTKSGATHEAIGNKLKKPRETVTRMINGSAGITPDTLVEFIDECGNAYFLQYLANRFGFELKLIDPKAKRIRELQEQLKRELAA
jgi:plasmid maintenance system antidote protein VapI